MNDSFDLNLIKYLRGVILNCKVWKYYFKWAAPRFRLLKTTDRIWDMVCYDWILMLLFAIINSKENFIKSGDIKELFYKKHKLKEIYNYSPYEYVCLLAYLIIYTNLLIVALHCIPTGINADKYNDELLDDYCFFTRALLKIIKDSISTDEMIFIISRLQMDIITQKMLPLFQYRQLEKEQQAFATIARAKKRDKFDDVIEKIADEADKIWSAKNTTLSQLYHHKLTDYFSEQEEYKKYFKKPKFRVRVLERLKEVSAEKKFGKIHGWDDRNL